MDGDGFRDFAIGSNVGGVRVIFGSPAGFECGVELVGDEGESLAAAGDIDGDGLDDLLIGSPYDGAGAAYLVLGASL